MKNTYPILIVDDEADILDFLSVILSAEGFQLLTARNGKEALTVLEKNTGEVQAILSDVHMPELDGYEFCKAVRADQHFKHLPFLFISALTDLEEKLKGYAAGADDYITKPIIEPKELIAKTRYFIDNKLQHVSLNKQLSDSFQTTMSAMTYSSHLGQILLFLQEASHMSDYVQVAERLLETAECLGINAVIKFSTLNGDVYFRKHGDVTPIEKNIIELARARERFFDFDNRTIISYELFSLLVKNMPKNNPEAYGTMKDVLGNLCNAIETITEVMHAKEINQHKNETMQTVNVKLGEIETTINGIQQDNSHIIETMIDEVNEAMLTLGLTDQQEESIRTITQRCLLDSRKVLKKADILKESFGKLHKNLESESKE